MTKAEETFDQLVLQYNEFYLQSTSLPSKQASTNREQEAAQSFWTSQKHDKRLNALLI